MKSVVMLATIHQYQIHGNQRSQDLENRLDYLRSKFGIQIVMEEWAEKRGQSVSAKFATGLGLHWDNAGTPDEVRFRTYTAQSITPGHDGPNADWDAPGMDEYGPFENQEARENRMVTNVQAEMGNYQTGLFIVGLGHTHSLTGLRPSRMSPKGCGTRISARSNCVAKANIRRRFFSPAR